MPAVAVLWLANWPFDLRSAGGGGSAPSPTRQTSRTGSERAASATFVRDHRGPARVWAVGDGADGGAAARAVAARIEQEGADRFLYLGDVYETGTAAEFSHNYAPLYGGLARRTAPTPGNHDWPLHRQGYDPYWKRVTGQTPPDHYSFTVGGWKLISLNSESPHGPGSAQLRWLRRQVARRGTCRLAFWHRPRFSAGAHGDQPDVQPFWDVLRGHAALVLNGHDHNMQRLRPRGGVTELVSGAGGHSHYQLDPGYRGLAFHDVAHYGALLLRLRPGLARYAFVAADGRRLDSGTVRCRRR